MTTAHHWLQITGPALLLGACSFGITLARATWIGMEPWRCWVEAIGVAIVMMITMLWVFRPKRPRRSVVLGTAGEDLEPGVFVAKGTDGQFYQAAPPRDKE